MSQLTVPTLANGDLRLRAPHADDVAARFALGNTPEIQHMFGIAANASTPLTRAGAEHWVTARIATPDLWVIEYHARLIGDAFLHTINTSDRRASLALGILDAPLLGCGIGTRVFHLLVSHAFGTMNLHRISLRVLEYNARAIAAYKKLGFVVEGRERQSALVGDIWHDDIIMGLLAPEYRGAA